jgi:DNA-binding PadR family transcriptional regulator
MSQKKLSNRDLKVLLAIMRCQQDAYAASILEKLRQYADENLSLGALHSSLDGLGRRGMVVTWMGEATKVRGGKRKKYIKVTGDGQIAVSDALRVLQGMSAGLGISGLGEGVPV